MNKILVPGTSGLIGSEVVRHFNALGWKVYGIDNNMRADFFGPKGDNRWNQGQFLKQCENFEHIELDIHKPYSASPIVIK
jgi:CDP-paratose 2-epimerase